MVLNVSSSTIPLGHSCLREEENISTLRSEWGTLNSQQTHIRSWTLCRETEAPSGWTWSEPAAGPAPRAGAAPRKAPGRCHCCLFETERGREGGMERQTGGKRVKGGEKKQGGFDRHWVCGCRSTLRDGRVTRITGRPFVMGQAGVKEGVLKEGGKDNREALSLWWKWHQLLITFFCNSI